MNNAKDDPAPDQRSIKVQSTSIPEDRPDFYTWCKQLRVSMLHNKADNWLDFEQDRGVLLKNVQHKKDK